MQLIYNIVRLALYPFVRYLLPLMSPSAAKRLQFERRYSLPNPPLRLADIAFEVSSEGELEQVYSVLEILLASQKMVELVFCSPSVEHKVLELKKCYPDNLRILAYPILSFQPFSQVHNVNNWLTARKLVLCRYDFFPELINYGLKEDVHFILFSGALGDWENKSWLSKKYLKYCYQSFNQIVAVSEIEKVKFIQTCEVVSNKVEVFDFRTIQIMKRSEQALEKLSEKIKVFPAFLQKIQTFEGNKIILGSYWDDDFQIVEKLSHRGALLMVAHHELSKKNLESFLNRCRKSELKVCIIDAKTEPDDLPKTSWDGYIFIFVPKGLLCELYRLFPMAYVGGGFGKSIHSVLEPYISGCRVVTGPNIKRSTEFDIIKTYDPKAIHSFKEIDKVVESLDRKLFGDTEFISFGKYYESHLAALMSWLDILEGEESVKETI